MSNLFLLFDGILRSEGIRAGGIAFEIKIFKSTSENPEYSFFSRFEFDNNQIKYKVDETGNKTEFPVAISLGTSGIQAFYGILENIIRNSGRHSDKAEIKIGNRMKLKNIPIGTQVFNIELSPGKGGQIVRAAGTSAQVLAHEGKYTHLKMPSKEIRKVLSECFATIGQVSHPTHRYEKLKKAGQVRLKGRRPQVRGTVMSPRAHPHGGGEGKTPIGLPYPKTPWGKPARGVKTRKRKWTDKYIIKRRKE